MRFSKLSNSSAQQGTRAKTPQNQNNFTSKNRRETQSLAKSPVQNQSSPNSYKKIETQANSNLGSLKLESIKENIGNCRYFWLGKGNNHEMVKKILTLRKGWVETDNKEDFIYLKWTQSNFGFKYHTLGKECLCFNHFEYHRELSNKQRLVFNMVNYCETNRLNAYNYIPLTYVIDLTTGEEDMALHNFLKFYNRNIPANNPQQKLESIILPKIKYQPYNSQAPNKRPQGYFYCKPVMPKTFVAQDQSGKSSYLWILKPTFMNRGRGIALFSTLEEFEKLIWKFYQGEDLEDYCDKNLNIEEIEAEKTEIIIPPEENKSLSISPKDAIIGSSSKLIVEQEKSAPKVWTSSETKSQSEKKIDTVKQIPESPKKNAQTKETSITQSPNQKLNPKQQKEEKPTVINPKMQMSLPVNNLNGSQQHRPSLKKSASNNEKNEQMMNSARNPSSKNQLSSTMNLQKTQQQPSNITSSANQQNISTGNSNPPLRVLVQKYIESPMLINERKFDIRIWAMLTPSYEVYFFREGYLRFSSYKYSTKDHNNPFIHLTNNSVQKYSSDYNEESGNQIYLSEMKNHMPESNYTKMQAKIREVIWITMISSRRKINVNARKDCFEIFGYDFMVDSAFKLWLIEINTNPAIDDNSSILKKLIPRMLDDAFKLTIDKMFNNKMEESRPNFDVPDFDSHENMWELLGDFKEGVNEKVMGKKLSHLRR